MYSLTIHNMDAAVYSQLYAIAEQEDLSLSQVVKRLLRDALDALRTVEDSTPCSDK